MSEKGETGRDEIRQQPQPGAHIYGLDLYCAVMFCTVPTITPCSLPHLVTKCLSSEQVGEHL